jgi:hypothetical protein
MSAEADILLAKRELVIANRILAREDVIDDYGHVSVRHPVDPSRFFLSQMYSERVIHGTIFSARPDVHAVTHHHARAVLPFTNTPTPLKPIFHMGSVIGSTIPLWESRDSFGDTNMLVDTLEKGHSLAQALGGNSCALLRGHGAVCVGASLKAACFVSIYLKENAQLVLDTLPLGPPIYLSDEETRMTAEMLLSPRIIQRFWDYRLARAGFKGL